MQFDDAGEGVFRTKVRTNPGKFADVRLRSIRGFVAENVTYRYYAKSEDEANYLVGVLNSSVVNETIKPFQPQGLMGERDIHRRPFEVCNIPLFDPADELHLKIAEVSAAARKELLPLSSMVPIPVAQARKFARQRVMGKIAQLDELMRKLLNSAQLATKQKKASSSQGEFL